MSGGKGGKQTTSVDVPAWLEGAAQSNLDRAAQAASIGYVPYYGPDVAAMTPSQAAAMRGVGQAASAFGVGGEIDPYAGMPTAYDYGGMQAYSSGPLYDQALAYLKQKNPEQFAKLNAPFSGGGIGGYGAPAAPAPVAATAPAAGQQSYWSNGTKYVLGADGTYRSAADMR